LLKAKPSEIIFTSGGTEANNLAIFGTARLLAKKGKHLITSTVEHHAVLHCFDYLEAKEGFPSHALPVDSTGGFRLKTLKKAFRPDTTLVSIMAANNEIGTIQPVAELGAICRERGVIFHTDAVQWFGKEPFQASSSSTPTWFPSAPTSFTGRKALESSTSGRHCIPTRSSSAADMRMNDAPARKTSLPSPDLVEALERFIPSLFLIKTKLSHFPPNNCRRGCHRPACIWSAHANIGFLIPFPSSSKARTASL
jgi:hypothetical protein